MIFLLVFRGCGEVIVASAMDDEERLFGPVDYVLFVLMLVISAAIGIFYGCWGGKQKTTKEFLMANRSMSIIPVAISILVSFMSAILILGTPAEMYTQGTQYMIYIVGILLAIVIAALIFVPLLYPLKLTSSFEVSSQTVNTLSNIFILNLL